jgi:hypothetical protein
METLTIRAASRESAQDFCAALGDFRAELEEAERGTFLVSVTFSGGNREMIAVLRALEECVSRRSDGPAVVGVSGQTYTLHPTDPPEPRTADSPTAAAQGALPFDPEATRPSPGPTSGVIPPEQPF